ncbi:trypsin-like peptidase domain-containing protein [Xanthomonas translucens pv. undulosa]|uniref:trypsin-like peptidase domain-containing protein n=1 Tax=Xanthomonas campestris pv. translucens TaxID=343 RepID=UPI003CED0341
MKLVDLQGAHDYESLALLFGTSSAILRSIYSSSGYKSFLIPKKSGGVRTIAAPMRLRRSFQKKLLPLLDSVYRPSEYAHGFVTKRNVRTNAQPHVGRTTLINVDLLDFFSSITFKRVRGLFLSSPFRLQWPIANILAHLCCYNGLLPAGGITSPVISNLVMSRLDKRLGSLVKRLGGEYSRYADDMSMSFNRPIAQLSSLILVDNVGNLSVGAALNELLKAEGFEVNPSKLRVSTKKSRKSVTGLIVNERVNVARKWYLNLESKIYAVEKFGWAAIARKEYSEIADVGVASRKLMRRLHGKLAYLQMIRGRGDWICSDLAARFNALHTDSMLRVPSTEIISRIKRADRGIMIVLGYGAAQYHGYVMTPHQGTGFCTPSGVVVTAAHVIYDDAKKKVVPYVYVMNERSKTLHECQVLAFDNHRDVAILKIMPAGVDLERHRFGLSHNISQGLQVTSIGYPNYMHGNLASIQSHQVVKRFVSSAVKKAQINGAVQGGLSGSPLFDSNMHVVGLVHKGNGAVGGIPELIELSEVENVANAAGVFLK